MSPAERGPASGHGPGGAAAPCCCGGGELRPVRALRRLSERVAAEEARAATAAPGGWEEAVQGWGETAPFACFQLQKQAKKSKANETVNNCLFCSDMLQSLDKSLGQEVKTRRNQSKSDGKLSESASEKEEISTRSSKSNCYPTADGIKTEVHHSKLHSVQTSQGEKKNLPIKEYCMWNLDVKNPEAVRHKEIKPQGLNILGPNSSASLTSKSLLLFPPVKDATPNDTSDPSWRNKTTIISQKMLSGTSVEIASYNQDAKAVEQKSKKGTDVINDQVKEKIEIHELSSFVPSHTKVSLLQEDPEQSHWHYALAANKNIATVSNPVALRKNSHHACKQLPHTEGIQHTKHYDIQGSLTNNVRNRYVEVKQEKEAKIQDVPPLSGLLPSLTVKNLGRDAPFICHPIQSSNFQRTHSAGLSATGSKSLSKIESLPLP